MAKRKIHPEALRRALEDEAERVAHPQVTHKPVEGKADALEAEAREQFAAELRDHIPGLAISPIPCRFVVPCKPTGSRTLSLSKYWRDPLRWQDARAELADPFHYAPPMEPRVPKGWSFAKVVGDAMPVRFDLANPRVYTLEGRQVLWGEPPGSVGLRLTATFEHMLVELYRKAATNTKRAEVVAFLDHHRTNGDNPSALADHVERLLEQWKASAPTYVDLHKPGRMEVPNVGQLTKLVEEWLATALKAPLTAKGTRPDLRLLALVHALRYLSGEGAHYISESNARTLAESVGAMAPSSPEDLRKLFARYALWDDRHAQRLGHGKRHTLLKRFGAAIQMLEDSPKAKAMAQRELEELRERE